MRFINLGLKPKIMSGSFLPVLICIFIGMIGIWTLYTLTDILVSASRAVQLGRHTLEIERNAAEMERAVHEYLLTGGEQASEQYKKAWTALSKELAGVKEVVAESNEPTKAFDDATKAVENW